MKRMLARLPRTPLVYTLLTLAVLLPMLTPGYILTLDMIFTPQLRMPDSLNNTYILYALLHYVDFLIPSEVLQKTLLFLALFGAGIGMHRLVEYARLVTASQDDIWQWVPYVAGFFYMVNPFTYSRLMAGQYLVLLGVAILPFLARALLGLVRRPSKRSAIYTAAWMTLLGMVSLHSLGLAVVVGVAAVGGFGWPQRQTKGYLKRLGSFGLLAIGGWILLSSHWLIPHLLGKSNTAKAITQFDAADTAAFATGGENVVAQIIHTLRLQGFWAEEHNLYLLPQDIMPVWGLVVCAVWIVIGVGVVTMWRHQRQFAIYSLLQGGIGVVLGAGIGVGWLSAHLPFFAGYREPQKFVALVALSFALWLAFGAVALWQATARRFPNLLQPLFFGLLLLPVMLTPVMFWGCHGQLTPRTYPHDWTQLNEKLNQDKEDFRVLFLPWHQYMSFQFAGRIIMNPAEKFFDKPTLTNNDPEMEGIGPTVPDEEKARIGTRLTQAPQSINLGSFLAQYDVKYIVLAKDYDYKEYSYLSMQKDLSLATETETLKVFTNTAFRGN